MLLLNICLVRMIVITQERVLFLKRVVYEFYLQLANKRKQKPIAFCLQESAKIHNKHLMVPAFTIFCETRNKKSLFGTKQQKID